MNDVGYRPVFKSATSVKNGGNVIRMFKAFTKVLICASWLRYLEPEYDGYKTRGI
jgi:hypothetical protein